MRTEIEGLLEIDHERGVVYFTNQSGRTIFRIEGLSPIPELNKIATKALDIRIERASVNYAPVRPEPEEEPNPLNSVG